jgi:hypothetical protein
VLISHALHSRACVRACVHIRAYVCVIQIQFMFLLCCSAKMWTPRTKRKRRRAVILTVRLAVGNLQVGRAPTNPHATLSQLVFQGGISTNTGNTSNSCSPWTTAVCTQLQSNSAGPYTLLLAITKSTAQQAYTQSAASWGSQK